MPPALPRRRRAASNRLQKEAVLPAPQHTVSMKELLTSGVHFGHQTRRWNPKMKPYIFGARNGIYIIDLQKTVEPAREACDFVTQTGRRDGKTSSSSAPRSRPGRHRGDAAARRHVLRHQPLARRHAHQLQHGQASASIACRRSTQDAGRHAGPAPSKKEQSRCERELREAREEPRRHQKHGPAARRHLRRRHQARSTSPSPRPTSSASRSSPSSTPTATPTTIDYVIPGNDDAIRSCDLIVRVMADAVAQGRQLLTEAEMKAAAERKAAEEAAVAAAVAAAEAEAAEQAAAAAADAAKAKAEAAARRRTPPRSRPRPRF